MNDQVKEQEFEVDCYFFGKFVKTVLMTKKQMEKYEKVGREYNVVNDRIVTIIPYFEESRILETNSLNDPQYCLEHNC